MTTPAPKPEWGTKARFGAASAVGLQVAMLVAIVIAANWISSKRYRRADLTSEAAYSLSEKTTQLLAKISEGEARFSIIVFYYPDEEGAWEAALKRTQDLLEEYATRSQKRISYEVVQIAAVGGGGVDAARKKYAIHSGIVANDVVFKSGEKERVVNLREFFGQSWDDVGPKQVPKLTSFNGEMIVTSVLQVLSQSKPVVLGFTTGHEEADPDDVDNGGNWGIFAHGLLEQREGYSIRKVTIPPGGEIRSKEVDVLVIAGPRHDFNEGETNVLKLFMAQGGRMLVTLDGGPERGDRPLPNLFAFLNAYGVKPQVDMVLDPDVAISQNTQQGPRKMPWQFVVGTFDPKHPVTAKFQDRQIVLIGTCSLLTDPGAAPEGMTVSEIAHCTGNGWGEKDFPRDHEMTPSRDEPGPLAVAVAVGGVMKGNLEENPTRLVVIGDSTDVANATPPELRTPDLMLNSIRWLAFQEWLITVEKKRATDKSLVLSDNEQSYVFRVCVLGMPVLAIAFGFTMFWTRRSA